MNKEIKKRYKMYKAGKNWVVAPIVFLGLTAGLGYQTNVKADNVSSQRVVIVKVLNNQKQAP